MATDWFGAFKWAYEKAPRFWRSPMLRGICIGGVASASVMIVLRPQLYSFGLQYGIIFQNKKVDELNSKIKNLNTHINKLNAHVNIRYSKITDLNNKIQIFIEENRSYIERQSTTLSLLKVDITSAATQQKETALFFDTPIKINDEFHYALFAHLIKMAKKCTLLPQQHALPEPFLLWMHLLRGKKNGTKWHIICPTRLCLCSKRRRAGDRCPGQN